ncbi:MAG TPA: PLP-dependent aminotransferase family protein [Gemmatimonadaceae bacterium]|nr:PLP-dependent aminotransferase family protein [Gemmatimonadaceae bacterium]
MPGRARGGAPLLIPLDPDAAEPLYRQIYRALREAILGGRLLPGVRLPSTRTLATELGVSRNTVLAAYDQLLAEGYLDGRVGSGTVVAESGVSRLASVAAARPPSPGSGVRAPSRRGARVASLPIKLSFLGGASRAFSPGVPALDEFPLRLWRRLASRRRSEARPSILEYGDSPGYRPLREAVAGYLGAARGVRCDPDQVLIVAGSQQALDLTARVVLDPGDTAWIEDPGYFGARGALVAAGARVVAVPLDDEGLSVDAGIARAPDARLAYVTPSHQFPTGMTMSLARRLALLDWARRRGAWILEDDYDSEFRYASRPLSALQGIDADGLVIYTGTFSKVLFPALRLGYLVAPPALVDAFVAARLFTDTHAPIGEQAVLAEFLAEGHFERHVRRMRSLYHERQEVLIESAKQELAPALTIGASEAGMHVVGWLAPGADDCSASRQAARHGVDAIAISAFALEPPARGGLVLGYSHLAPAEIRGGVRKLKRALLG